MVSMLQDWRYGGAALLASLAAGLFVAVNVRLAVALAAKAAEAGALLAASPGVGVFLLGFLAGLAALIVARLCHA